jgi:ArsR family transcriptional regulator
MYDKRLPAMPAAANSAFETDSAQLARRLKALAHPARLSIIEILAERDECICGEIVADLPLAQSTVSQHLKALKEAGLVQGSVDGPRTCYCLDPAAVAALEDDLGAFFDDLSPTAADCC